MNGICTICKEYKEDLRKGIAGKIMITKPICYTCFKFHMSFIEDMSNLEIFCLWEELR